MEDLDVKKIETKTALKIAVSIAFFKKERKLLYIILFVVQIFPSSQKLCVFLTNFKHE